MAEITGTSEGETLTGTGDPDTISGLGGNDTLHGLGGDDVLDGGSGGDAMEGGQGDDVYGVDSAGDLVTEAAGGGDDKILASVSYVLPEGSEVEILSAADHEAATSLNFTGNDFANQLWGTNGANVLDGGAAADVMFGFGGNDVYYVDDAADDIFESAGKGLDIAYASTSYALTRGSEVEIVSAIDNNATTALNLTGNEYHSELWGTNGANVLDGAGGADVMLGFSGDDRYFVDHGDDDIYEGAGRGRDITYASIGYTLTLGSEVEILSAIDNNATTALDLTGNELNNELWGNNGANVLNGARGNDILNGLGGNDTLIGGDGNDIYFVDSPNDAIIEGRGRGRDVAYASVSFTLAKDAEVEVLSAIDNNATTALNLTGSDFDNELWGNNGDNVLNGGAGADRLFGFGGADTFVITFTGSANIDTIVGFQVGTDKIVLGGGAGEPFDFLASGTLLPSAFVIGTAVTHPSNYIIYDSATGALLRSVDGVQSFKFLQVAPGLSLTAADFIVSGLPNNAPVVTSGESASIAENSPASTIVYQARGSDGLDFDRKNWTLGGPDADLLTIDPLRGEVRLIAPADFEKKTSYVFTVTVSDSGSSSAPKQVTLTVTDVAESAPLATISATSASDDSIVSAPVIDQRPVRESDKIALDHRVSSAFDLGSHRPHVFVTGRPEQDHGTSINDPAAAAMASEWDGGLVPREWFADTYSHHTLTAIDFAMV